MATISNLLYEDPEEIRRKMIELGIPLPAEMEPPPFQGDVRALMRETDYPVSASQFQGDARAMMREPAAYPQPTVPISAILQPETPIAPAQPQYSFKPGTVTKLAPAASDADRKARDKAFMEALQAQDAQFRQQEMPAKDLQGLMQQVMAMAQPGYKTRSSDPAYSSMVYERGMPIEQIVQTPQYKMLQSMGPMFKQQAEIDKMRAEAEKARGVVSPASKPLTMEAKIAADLKAGLLTKEEADAAMAATPGGKEKAKESETQRNRAIAAASAIDALDAVKRNIGLLYDETTGKLRDPARSIFGQFDQYRPDLLLSQASVDARTALQSLSSQLTLSNLADAKKAVGQSFGSMQVKEWDKFLEQLASMSRAQSEDQAAESLKYVLDFINKKYAVLQTALNAGSQAAPPQAVSGGKAMTMQDVMDTARKAGRSVDEVIAAARAKGYTIQ